MSAGAAVAGGGEASRGAPLSASSGGTNPWAIAMVVSLATFMEVLDTTIANVALRYIAGGLAVGPDEAAWVVTSYLVANAIVLTASSFLAGQFGRKAFFMFSIALFTVASVLCGFAWNLESLIAFRVLQGLGGGGMAPLAQAILADSFPPAKRGQAFALYGLAIVVAPVIGPTLGGWLSDNASWHWCFLINGPVGVAALGLMHVLLRDPPGVAEERRRRREAGIRFDLVGFLLVATFLGSLEVVLDEGQRKDWFGSTFIIVFATIAALAFVAMIPWELTRKNPVVDLALLGRRQFGACFVVMLATGAILIATTQFLPQLVQEYFGYTATLAGLVLAPGGLVTVAVMLVIGRLMNVVQPKYLIAGGATMVALAMYDLTRLYGESSFWFFAWSRIYIGIGLPMTFLSITAASYEGIGKAQIDQASALINVARNVGGSIGVSFAQNLLASREQFHQSRLVENVTAPNPAYQESVRAATQYFVSHGTAPLEAQRQAVAWIGQQLQIQVAYLSYIDVFWGLCLMSSALIPLALILSRTERHGDAPMAH